MMESSRLHWFLFSSRLLGVVLVQHLVMRHHPLALLQAPLPSPLPRLHNKKAWQMIDEGTCTRLKHGVARCYWRVGNLIAGHARMSVAESLRDIRHLEREEKMGSSKKIVHNL